MPAEVEALGSLDDKSGVDVVDRSIAGAALQALSRPTPRSVLFGQQQSCNSKLI